MISLKDYVLEKLFINENKLEPKDWAHRGNFDYCEMVMNDIIKVINKEKPYIILGDKNNEPFKYLTFNISQSNDIIKDIEKLITSKKDKTHNDFNDIFNTLNDNNFTIYNDKDLKIKSNNQNIRNLWGKIWKGPYSGKESAGASYGQIFESLVCFLYNYCQKNKYDESYIEEWVNRFNVNKNNSEYVSWIDSSKNSTNILKDFFGNNYIAYHVDENNLFHNEDDKKYLDVCKLFSGKNGIYDVLGKGYNDIYQGKEKDKWNAADIVLVNKKLDINSLFKTLQNKMEIPNGEALNVKLVELTLNKDIIPVSLKNIQKGGHLYSHNIKTDDIKILIDKYEITDISLKLGQNYKPNETTGNLLCIGLTVDGTKAEIQIRAQTGNDNLSIESKIPTNKFAKGGKGISVIKQAIGYKDNSYYDNTLKSNNDIWEFFDKYFHNEISKTEWDNLSNKYHDLYKRTCYRGLIGLYKVWLKQWSKNPDKTKENPNIAFVKFLWISCTECPGSYYIIK